MGTLLIIAINKNAVVIFLWVTTILIKNKLAAWHFGACGGRVAPNALGGAYRDHNEGIFCNLLA
jgi:hypothetical protein